MYDDGIELLHYEARARLVCKTRAGPTNESKSECDGGEVLRRMYSNLVARSDNLGLDAPVCSRTVRAEPRDGVDVGLLS